MTVHLPLHGQNIDSRKSPWLPRNFEDEISLRKQLQDHTHHVQNIDLTKFLSDWQIYYGHRFLQVQLFISVVRMGCTWSGANGSR
jgi:hypothetical protein